MDLLKEIEQLFISYTTHQNVKTLSKAPLFNRIREKINESQELVFLLPAFPAKSPSPVKTSGNLPDMGEVLALKSLQDLCEKISSLYSPGARIIICSDGRVFSEVVKVSDEEITSYQNGIQEILKTYNLNKLTIFSLDDVYTGSGFKQRELLLSKNAKSLEEIRNLVLMESDYKKLFNGLHRFLLEDELVLNTAVTKNKANQETKVRAYELLRRSDAWSMLLQNHFPDALRLSIHPYAIEHEKFGIKLIKSSNKWATPWHNVLVKMKDHFELMHLKEAMQLQASLKFMEDKYAYYEISSL